MSNETNGIHTSSRFRGGPRRNDRRPRGSPNTSTIGGSNGTGRNNSADPCRAANRDGTGLDDRSSDNRHQRSCPPSQDEQVKSIEVVDSMPLLPARMA
jgi:hypothetical protein